MPVGTIQVVCHVLEEYHFRGALCQKCKPCQWGITGVP